MVSITIPFGLTAIGKNAFSGCNSLTDVTFGGAREQWDAIRIGAGNDRLLAANVHCLLSCVLNLPTDLTRIESEAFAGLSGAVGVRVPAGVAYIAQDAFAGTDAVLIVPEGSYAQTWAQNNKYPCYTE